jgi:hypothetical protein
MEGKMIQRLAVGQPFPGVVPPQEGAVLELTAGGLTMLIQTPGLRPPELTAFRAGARRVCILEAGSAAVPICLVIVDWPSPLGPMDMSFDARRVRAEILATWLDTSEGAKNALQVILLDGQMVRGLKLMGLPAALVTQMRGVIRRQLAVPYGQEDFDRELGRVYQQSTAQLMARADCHRHRGDER